MSRPTRLRPPRPPERARQLASSCHGSAPATKITSVMVLEPRKAASAGGLLILRSNLTWHLFIHIDPQNNIGLLSIVKLAQDFRITLFSLALRIDLIVHIGRK